MKTVKLLLMSMFVVPAFAMDLEQSRKEEAMRIADIALFDAIENCHRNDGKHDNRMNELKNTTYNLSALETYFVLQRRFNQAISKSDNFRECNDCKDVEAFVGKVLYCTSRDINAGRGNSTISELQKLHVNK